LFFNNIIFVLLTNDFWGNINKTIFMKNIK